MQHAMEAEAAWLEETENDAKSEEGKAKLSEIKQSVASLMD